MKVLLILGHPKPGSFNHAIAEKVIEILKSQGHHVIYRDLYQEKFNPVLPVGEELLAEKDLPVDLLRHINELRQADGVVFVHPNWWGSPPAILRGWIERVIRTDSCYNFTAEGVKSYIGDKIIQIFSTSNTPEDVEVNVYKDPVRHYWETVVWGLLGSKSFERRNYSSVVMSTAEQRANWLAEIDPILKRRFSN